MVGKQIQKLLLFLTATTLAGAVEYTRERYDVIVDRSPFGEDPTIAIQEQKDAALNAKEAAEAAKLAQQMEKKIRLCYLLETDSGELRAAFENKGAKAGDPRSYMLRLNESIPGMAMKLTAIDIVNSSATLSMNGKPVTFELTKAATPAPAAIKTTAANTQRKFGGGFRRPQEPQKPAEPELSPEELAVKRAEITERLRHAQMDIIRKGQPPLPIPLTQDMDDQLVAEGVLPPSGAPAPGQ